MRALFLTSCSVVAILCAGCKTVIIRPAPVPECTVPPEFINACVATVSLNAQVTYGDLPDVLVRTREDFVKCRAVYVRLMQSYEYCASSLKQLNDKIRRLESDAKEKYKDAEVRDD